MSSGYVSQAISANAIGIVVIFAVFLNYRKKYRGELAEHRVYSAMLAINLFQCLLEPASIFIDGRLFDGAIPLSYLLNTLLFVNNIIFAYLWVIYAETHIRTVTREQTKRYALFAIPAVLVIIGAIVNLFTPLYFDITFSNVYERASLYIIPYAATYFYLIVGTVLVYGGSRRTDNYVFLPAVSFLLPVCLASIAQFLIQGISLLWVGAAVGLNSAYLSRLDEQSAIDALSGTYSRHYLNTHLLKLQHRTQGKAIAGIMFDIDRFKSINDTYGHLVGDDAISAVGAILRRASRNIGMTFRYAGDEFAMIIHVERESEVCSVIESIETELRAFNKTSEKPYELSLSYGYTFYNHGENSEQFLSRMDENMYAHKKSKLDSDD